MAASTVIGARRESEDASERSLHFISACDNRWRMKSLGLPERCLQSLAGVVLHLHYNVMMKKGIVQIRVEPELTALINQAVQRTGLSKSEVLRQGLRKGIPA